MQSLQRRPRVALFPAPRAYGMQSAAMGVALLAAAGVQPGAAAAQATPGTISDLGTLGGPYAEAAAMNAAGTVVGTSHDGRATRSARDSRGAAQAYLKRLDEPMVDLHDINGVDPLFINDHEAIVGERFGSNGQRYATYRWTAELGLQDLPAPSEIGRTRPAGIDNAGNILVTTSGGARSLLWLAATETFVELPCLPDRRCEATALNDAGQIVGVVTRDSNTFVDPAPQPVLWEGPAHALRMLPTSGAEGFRPVDVNAEGTIVGTAGTSEAPRAVAWIGPEHALRELGEGQPRAINGHDVVAGDRMEEGVDGSPEPRPVLWDLRRGTRLDLPLVEHGLSASAIDINDAGMVLAVGRALVRVGEYLEESSPRALLYRGFVPAAP